VDKVFLTAEWRQLLMLNYSVDPNLLLKYVPCGTELDQWNGHVFISLIGFRFLKTRAFGISFPFHRNFEEVNLRYYVRRQVDGGVRRGVVFIREIVPRRAIAAVANILYNENYVALPMSHRIRWGNDETLSVEYAWQSTATQNRMTATVNGMPHLPEDGSEQQFIAEHYWGYAAKRDGGTMEYHVEHPPWRVWNGRQAGFEGDVKELYGEELAAILRRTPSSAFVAEGSAVTVQRGHRL
jgi:uncharacterized protein YqjF (DUF2071 family)